MCFSESMLNVAQDSKLPDINSLENGSVSTNFVRKKNRLHTAR